MIIVDLKIVVDIRMYRYGFFFFIFLFVVLVIRVLVVVFEGFDVIWLFEEFWNIIILL